ncbi:MAG: zf-HC2 domain-containing protein [Myxococcota bacterium]|nr:zf-HC2 domain-containing protein [Myxococcota bacterium]
MPGPDGREPTGGIDHEAVFELLPWHANGSLEPEERSKVERHLVLCTACRDELAVLQDVQRAVHETREAAWEPPPGQLDRLMARLPRASEEGHAAASGPLRRWWGELSGSARLVFAAQTALAAGLAIALLWPEAPPPVYTTLTETATSAPEPRLEVAFAEDVTERDLRALLLAADARIVAGPSPRGIYTIALGPEARTEGVVAAFRSDRRVRFVEPLGRPAR